MRIRVKDDAGLRVELDEGETIELLDAEGRPFGLGERRAFSLCRCGRSARKPFCDASHKEGFESTCEAFDLG